MAFKFLPVYVWPGKIFAFGSSSICVFKVLVNEVNCYGERKLMVENVGSRLTDLSRKEDCDVIHNLIMTVQDRYKKLVQHTADRGKILEEVKKNARQVGSSSRKRLINSPLVNFGL